MSHSSPYPSPPYSQPEHMDHLSTKSLLASTWHVIEQPPPPTLREILSAYKSKGDGDRDMLLAMLNAKTAEDQRIAAVATLHQKILESRLSPPSRPSSHDHASPFAHAPGPAPFHPPSFAPPPRGSSPRDVTLPSIHPSSNTRKRARTSQSPPPMKRRHSGSHSVAASEQLPPSPPFSSPGRSAVSAELHPQARAMAIGSLLSSSSSSSNHHDGETEWPSRTSAERTGSASAAEREAYRRQSNLKASG